MGVLQDVPPTSEVVEALKRDGIYLLNNAISPESADAIRVNAKRLLEQRQPWYKVDQQGEDTYATISPNAIPRNRPPELENISNLFSELFFERVCKDFLAPDAIIDRIIVSKSTISDKPITLWHSDQQENGRLSFKFMLYLTDVTADSGAFSYVPGSHKMIHDVMETAAADGVTNVDLHSFEQISDIVDRYGNNEQKKQFSDIQKYVQGNYESDNHYSVSAKKGSILLFDTKGVHRGGVVRHDQRILIRIHCFEPDRRPDNRSLARRLVGNARAALSPNFFRWG